MVGHARKTKFVTSCSSLVKNLKGQTVGAARKIRIVTSCNSLVMNFKGPNGGGCKEVISRKTE